MIKKIFVIRKDELIRGGLILFIMINIFNFFNYLFHFSMARLLGPANYGILAVLMSIVYIFTIPTEAIQTVVTKYTSGFNAKREYGKIKDLFFKGIKKGFFFSLIIFLIFIPISFFLSVFLKIEVSFLLLTGLLIFYFLTISVFRGILQGRKKFIKLGINMVIESSIKVILAILLVLIGWKVYGAIAGILIAGIITFIFTLFLLKKILSYKRENTDFKGIYSYSLPVLIAIVSIVLMYSLDIIIAKRFFAPEIAGKYAVASMLGKIIFFGTFAIGKAMFPITSESHENGKKTSHLLSKSLKMVGLISMFALLLYLLFPKLIITILFGSAYVEVANILFIVGLSLVFLSFSNIFILYGLSINKIKKSSFLLLIFVILEIILFSIFHSTLLEFSFAFLIVNFLMFLYSLFLIRT